MRSAFRAGLPPAFILFCALVSTSDAALIPVASPAALPAAIASASAGDEVVLADGTYADAGLLQLSSAVGTSSQPVTIRPVTPGGVIFRGKTGLRLTGTRIVLRDFLFYQCRYLSTETPSSAVHLFQATHCQVLNNRFYQCGRTDTPFGHVVRLEAAVQNNTVGWNTFDGSTSMSVGIVAGAGANTANTGNIIEYNRFLNILPVGELYSGQVNGLECIQIGQGVSASGLASISYVFNTQVRRNRFENVAGDGNEIISVKTSGNTIAENTFSNCNSAISLRNGDNNTATGNFFINTNPALGAAGGINVVSGTGHQITNNYFSGLKTFAVQLYDTNNQSDRQPVVGVRIAHNTFAYQLGTVVRIGQSTAYTAPSGTVFENNVWVHSAANAMIERWANTNGKITYAGNYLWLTGSASLGLSPVPSGMFVNTVNPGWLSATGFWRPGNTALAGLAAPLAPGLVVPLDFDGEPRSSPAWPGADEGVATVGTAAPAAFRSSVDTSSGADWSVPGQVIVTASTPYAREQGRIQGAFTFTRASLSLAAPLTLAYSLSGTATRGTGGAGDYDTTALTGTVIIPANQASVTLPVIPIDDDLPETQESVTLTLTGAGAYLIAGTGSATVSVVDDDLLAPRPLYLAASPGGSTSRAITAINPDAASQDYALVPTDYLRPQSSTEATGPAYVWNDIAATGTRLTALDNKDDDFTSLALPFPFPFYGRFYSTLYVTTNGWLGLTPPTLPASYAALPLPTPAAPRNLIAFAQRDLLLDASSRVTWKTTAPDTVLVQFDDLTVSGHSAWRLSAQVQLKAGGEITFYYKTDTLGDTAHTIGLQDAEGLRASLYTYQALSPAASSAIRFQPVVLPHYAPLQKSTDAGGPAFAWNDISATGTILGALNNQDDSVAQITLPFSFPFYGQTFTAAYVTTNGWIAFTPPGYAFTNPVAFPSASAPANLIAFAWQDLKLDAASRIYTQSSDGGSTFTIQFHNLVSALFGDQRITAQIVLRKSGDIRIHYLSSTLSALGSQYSYAIGIQNADGTDAVSASFRPAGEAPFIANNLSLRFQPVRNWLSVNPARAFATPGAAATLAVQATAALASAGENFSARISLAPTGGAEALTLPVTFTVSGLDAPADLVATPLSPSGIRLDWTDDASGETGYQVERQSTPDGAWSVLTSSLPANTTNYADATAPAGAWLAYRVTALGSPAASAPCAPVSLYAPLAPPPAGAASVLDGHSLRLAWPGTALPAGLVATAWERSADSGASWQPIADRAATDTTFDDTGLPFATAFIYRYRFRTAAALALPSATFGATTLSAFAHWTATYFTPAEQFDAHVSGPLADPDGDGLVNLLEKAFGLNPRASDPGSGAPAASIVSDSLVLAYRRFTGSPFTCTPEASSDLVNWLSGPTVFANEQVTPLADGLEQVVSRDLTPLASSPRRFVRLRVGGWQTFAATVTLTPSTDRRLRDDNNDGVADLLDADTTDRLQTGDVATNAAWRSVYVFSLAYDDITAVLAAQSVTLRLTVVQVSGVATLPSFNLQIVSLPDPGADAIVLGDYAAPGSLVYNAALPVGLAAAQVLTYDVTAAAKAAARSGNRVVFRLQTSPATDSDGVAEFVAFYSGSGGLNTAAQRPQLIIQQPATP